MLLLLKLLEQFVSVFLHTTEQYRLAFFQKSDVKQTIMVTRGSPRVFFSAVHWPVLYRSPNEDNGPVGHSL